MRRLILMIAAAAITIGAVAQPRLTADNIDEVLSAMTLQEKATMLVGRKDFPEKYKGLPAGCTRAIERFGIPVTFLADGPAGVRVNHPCTGFPVGSLLACSWDTDLIEKMASAMGKEALEYGVDILLAPGDRKSVV